MRSAVRILTATALLGFAAGEAHAQASEQSEQSAQGSAIEATTAVVATDIRGREPVGEAEAFTAGVGTVYFFTTLEGDFPEQAIEHVWVHEGEEVARVSLNVRGPRWRTWSQKDIPSDWTGDWTVRALDADGAEIASVSFTVGEGAG